MESWQSVETEGAHTAYRLSNVGGRLQLPLELPAEPHPFKRSLSLDLISHSASALLWRPLLLFHPL